jgi:hypothetical protein
MTKGMRSYAKKQRRKIRRENHFAKDLRSPIFRNRRIENKNHRDRVVVVGSSEWYEQFRQDDYED